MEPVNEMFPSVISAEDVKSFYELVISGPSRIRSREDNQNADIRIDASKKTHLLDKLA